VADNRSVTTRRYNNFRNGWNPNEHAIATKSFKPGRFIKRWSRTVNGLAYAQPLYLANLEIPGKGTKNVLFVATMTNDVAAIDVDIKTSGPSAFIWQRNLGPAVPDPVISGVCGCDNAESTHYGIMGTPVIDEASKTLYCVAKKYDGAAQTFWLHALDVTTGEERSGYPVLIEGAVDGDGGGSHGTGRVPFIAYMQNQRCGLALSIVDGRPCVYVTFGSICDDYIQEYHGWIFRYRVDAPSEAPIVYCTSPEMSETGSLWKLCPWPMPVQAAAGIWMSGEAPAIDPDGNLFFATGNGLINADLITQNNQPGRNVGNSYVRLTPDLGFTPTNGSGFNYHTPSNERELDEADADLGSAGVMLVNHPGSSTSQLLIASAKDGRIRMMEQDNLGGFTGREYTRNPNIQRPLDNVLQKIEDFHGTAYSTMAYWAGPDGHIVFHSGNNHPVYQFDLTISSGKSWLVNRMVSGQKVKTVFRNARSTSPVITSNGSKRGTGVLWMLTRQNSADIPNAMIACDAEDISKTLWHTNQRAQDNLPGKVIKFTHPLVINGRAYVVTSGGNGAYSYITCYGVLETASP